MTDQDQRQIDALADRIDKLLVTGLRAMRKGRPDDALLILQEALETARRLPQKEGAPDVKR